MVSHVRAEFASHSERYLALREFLLPWSDLWGHSVFHKLDEMTSLVPESWFEFGLESSFEDQHRLLQGLEVPKAPRSLVDWLGSIRALCDLQKFDSPAEFHPELARGLTPKKKHEIQALLGLLGAEGVRDARILDIGGGVGHLARHLAHGLGCSVMSVDRDPMLQLKGREISARKPWSKVLKQSPNFVASEFPGNSEWDSPGWAIGLHTCGALAWSHLAMAQKGWSLVNVGCCYERLDPVTDVQRSRFAAGHPIPFTEEALFLATRVAWVRSQEEFEFQQRVLRFRFALYDLLKTEGCDPSLCEAVGTASLETYRGGFPGYVRDRLRGQKGLPRSLTEMTDSAIEGFFATCSDRVEKRRMLTYLRSPLARVIEVAILLDRAMAVEEALSPRGGAVRLVELFDWGVSPRNVALVVRFPESPFGV